MNKQLLWISIFLLFIGIILCSLGYAGDPEPEYLIRVELPFGSGNVQTAVVQGSEVQALLCAESFIHRKTPVQVRLDLPRYLEFTGAEDISRSGPILSASFTLRTENDTWFRLIRLRIRPDAPEGKHSITVHSIYNGKSNTWTVPFWIVSPAYMTQHIHFLRFSIPADEEGKRDLKQEANTISIKDTNRRWLRALSLGNRRAHNFETAGAEFENTGDYPVALNTEYSIQTNLSREPVDWLHDPGEETGTRAQNLTSPLLLRPHSRGIVLFKISSGDREMPAGEFRQKLSAGLLASGKEIISREFPLHIKEIHLTAAASAITATMISLLGFVGMFFLRKHLFGGFTSREYILIGLFAAVAFSLVSVPSTVAYNILHALMGPFSFLITGIFSEVIFYLLLMSLAVLIPRPGVMLLFVFTTYVLGGIILGNFTITSMILYPTQAVILELALLASGLYERNFSMDSAAGSSLMQNHNISQVFWAALIFGAADALFSYISFNLNIFVYRLYYAEWYILSYVFISGFLYTAITIPLGLKMGLRLRHVAVD